MNDRVIPVIILLLNFIFPVIVFQFLPNVSSLLLIGGWSFVSLFCLVVVAYWVYKDGKKIEFLEEHLWRRIDKLEENMKFNIRDIEDKLKGLEEQKTNQK
jgi:amino acid transporter